MSAPTLDDITSLCKRRGFVYPTSEIYGGLTSSYDYGPLGVELLRNIKSLWWKTFVQDRPDMVGIDSQILLHPETWVASGHVGAFNDPLVEDTVTKKRYRADHLIEYYFESARKERERREQKGSGGFEPIYATEENEWISLIDNKPRLRKKVVDMSIEDMADCIKILHIKSPDGNDVTSPKKFNLLFESKLGVIEDAKSLVYLRGETAQGIFTNFRNIIDSTRVTLPFGVGQIGKSFRNEITSGQFVFRTLEFEQAEIEYFFDPETSDWNKLFESWKQDMWTFAETTLGVRKENLRWRQHTDRERSHYSRDTYDLEYNYPFGWKELWGIAYRTDYDLMVQSKHSGADLSYTDPVSGKKFIPHVIEPAVGINRLFLMVLTDAFVRDDKRIVLKLAPKLAPKKVAVFPLVANKPDLVAKARSVYDALRKHIAVAWDDRGNIGKRYLSQDEAGTPWCVTVDYATLEDSSVTVRDRDTTKQERVNISQLQTFVEEKLQ